jgi:hypothetical protein
VIEKMDEARMKETSGFGLDHFTPILEDTEGNQMAMHSNK